MRKNFHAMAARGAILTASTYTAALQLWASGSLAFQAAGDGIVIDCINILVLLVSLLGWADLIWHDVHGRLILPSFNKALRHQICISTYMLISGAFAIRAFLAVGNPAIVLTVGLYYIAMSLVAAIEAAAIAGEQRHV